MQIELNLLKYFFEVARRRSFTRAGRALRVSQPGISKAVGQLESQIGASLFVRKKKGLLLTTEGEALLGRCEAIFREVDAFKAEYRSLGAACHGPLNLGGSDNLCNYVFPRVFKDFCKIYPKVVPRIYSGTAETIQTELLESRIELGLFYTPVSNRKLTEEKLCFVENVVAIPGFVERKRSETAVGNLPYIGSRREDYQGPYPALKLLRSLGIDPRVGFEINNQEAQKRMVVAGLGFSVMPKFMLEAELSSGTVRLLKTPNKIGNDLRMVKRQGAVLSRPALVFAEYLKANLSRYLQ